MKLTDIGEFVEFEPACLDPLTDRPIDVTHRCGRVQAGDPEPELFDVDAANADVRIKSNVRFDPPVRHALWRNFENYLERDRRSRWNIWRARISVIDLKVWLEQNSNTLLPIDYIYILNLNPSNQIQLTPILKYNYKISVLTHEINNLSINIK